MRRIAIISAAVSAAFLLLSTAVFAGGHNPSDYPLRVHIYQHEGHSHYVQRTLDYVDGEGRANLYEDGMPTGFDYGYRCGDRLMNSMGFETYMARWRKPGKTLEILLPVMGNPNAAHGCELKVEMKAGIAYFRRDGQLAEMSSAALKQWMEKVQYDPEHGKDVPLMPAPAAAPPPTPSR
jgi:hypothetical protein